MLVRYDNKQHIETGRLEYHFVIHPSDLIYLVYGNNNHNAKLRFPSNKYKHCDNKARDFV